VSQFGIRGARCDWCGKFSRNNSGEYTKPDGVSAGYIHAPPWDADSDNDICEECANDLCPFCGSACIVKTTPAIPGPNGWGGRCKACAKWWGMPTAQESQL
jgi:hypothetical protein